MKDIGSVYFITDGQKTKIGITTKGVISRLHSLQTGSPVNLTLVASLNIKATSSSYLKEVESHIHRQYEFCHSHGEWFDRVITVQEIKNLVGVRLKYYAGINVLIGEALIFGFMDS